MQKSSKLDFATLASLVFALQAKTCRLSIGDGKYLVHYNDMGNKGTHTITIAIQDGDIFFDKLD